MADKSAKGRLASGARVRAPAPDSVGSATLPEHTADPVSPGPYPDEPRGRTRFLQRVWVQRLLTYGALLALWQWFAASVGPYFFPSLAGVAQGYIEVLQNGSLVLVAQSFQQMFLGFGLAVVVGVPIGLLMGSFRTVEWFLGPYVNILFVTSLAAILPLIILFFGTGFQFRVAVVFLFSIFYVIINPANGVRSIDAGVVEMSRSFNAGKAKRFFAITFPGTLPFIFAGLRLGLGQAIQGMIIAELWVTIGAGRELVTLGLDRELGQFFALASIIVVIGALLTQLLLIIQKWISPWSTDVSASVKGAS